MTKLMGIIKSENKLTGNLGVRNEINVSIIGTGPRGEQGIQGPMGTTNYNLLENRPSIQSIELIGNRTFEDLGLSAMTPSEIENLI